MSKEGQRGGQGTGKGWERGRQGKGKEHVKIGIAKEQAWKVKR
jgi:hypothetical protein